MTKYKIMFSPAAEKQLMRLTKIVRIRIVQAIYKLANNPQLGKQLKGQLKDYRSFRVGSYRVVYFIRYQKIQVEIIRISHRKEAYKS